RFHKTILQEFYQVAFRKKIYTDLTTLQFHKTILQEFYQVAFRKKIYTDLTTLQADLDEWLMYYNHHRTHRGKMCCGRTPMATLLDGKRIWVEKNLSSN
ncbi:hypothetical protein P2G87_03815, partial [Mannheimia haemolytica]|nr:hypothetical protein [Mannheimia haemolytica]